MFAKYQKMFSDYIETQLIGPALGEFEKIEDRPDKRYLMGMLFPRDTDTEQSFSEEEEGEAATDSSTVDDSPLRHAFQKLPASIGMSFYVEGSGDLNIEIYGSKYTKPSKEDLENNKRIKWVRCPIASKEEPFLVRKSYDSKNNSQKNSVLNDSAELHVLWRVTKKGFLITVTLINDAQAKSDSRMVVEDCLFQVGMMCRPIKGRLIRYPGISHFNFDEEDQELSLQYRNTVAYGIGHGCSVEWTQKTKSGPDTISTSFLPRHEVKHATTQLDSENKEASGKILQLQYLMNEKRHSGKLKSELNQFLDGYKEWIKIISDKTVEHCHIDAKKRVVERLIESEQRMRSGINCIVENRLVYKSFCLANRAMLMQMVHSRDDYGGKIKNRGNHFIEPDYDSEKFAGYSWRPFQLAFFLLVVRSMVDKDCDERKYMDLIWFPTGGGKTEAYLALAAFEIFRRRLENGEEGLGTAVIKRYTLRLLTTQQFQRASTLICACEALRKIEANDLLGEPFTLGLWVGGENSPNHFTTNKETGKGSLELYETMRNADKPENEFQLQKCPWCGTRIVPEYIKEDDGYYGITATETTFKFFCPSQNCPFHNRIPVSVVDEDLFQSPPTMLIGTIDKFARLAWDNRAKVFFGAKSRGILPPSLIIQDELHLISGPLGTIAGIYESAIDTLIECCGAPAKIIAATATIRRADDQVKKLYAREVRIFPSPGIDSDDSYFSREDKSRPGRLYMGVMGQGHTPLTALVHLSGALNQAMFDAGIDKNITDHWWTQAIYHNSRRELGKTMTLARDDIPSRSEVIARDGSKIRNRVNVEELSSNIKGKKIPELLEQLEEVEYPNKDAIDILPCTNMISVGVDIKRLGLMVVNGQPKTTSEYIQATSRVGRDPKRAPGVIVTLYSGTKPRDRSHYENFTGYHQELYRAVEPTSVTPFAPPARDRALHAALIILMRFAGSIGENEDAGKFNMDDQTISNLVLRLKERMSLAEPSVKNEIQKSVDELCEEWRATIEEAKRNNKRLQYDSSKAGRQFRALMCFFNQESDGKWPTLNSMRNVDQESRIRIKGENQEQQEQ
jgi:hypothetical protein